MEGGNWMEKGWMERGVRKFKNRCRERQEKGTEGQNEWKSAQGSGGRDISRK